MKKLMFLTMMFGLMIVFTGSVSAQNKGNGYVLTINGTTEFTPQSGDEIVASIATSDGNYGLSKGMKYSRIEVRQTNKIMYIYYATDEPDLQYTINNREKGRTTKVDGVCDNSKPFTKNDKFSIQAQPADGGGTLVTFTSDGKGCFLFIAK